MSLWWRPLGRNVSHLYKLSTSLRITQKRIIVGTLASTIQLPTQASDIKQYSTNLPPPWVQMWTLPIDASSNNWLASWHLGHSPPACLIQSRQKACRQRFYTNIKQQRYRLNTTSTHVGSYSVVLKVWLSFFAIGQKKFKQFRTRPADRNVF